MTEKKNKKVETRTHSKNGATPKSQTSREIKLELMKTLSIIGIVISFFGILFGLHFAIQNGFVFGWIMLIGALYFLAFSITSTVISFRKKKVDAE